MPDQDRDALLAFYDFPAEHWKHLPRSQWSSSSSRSRSRPPRLLGLRSLRVATGLGQ